MMMVTRSGILVALLVVVNVLLLALLGYQWVKLDYEQAVNNDADVDQETMTPQITNKQSFAKHPISDYAAVTSRPLFNKDRLPLPEDGSGDDEEETHLSLLGVVLTPQQQVAILYSKTQKKPVKTALWDWVDGWRLISVKPKQVVLRKGNRTLELQLQPGMKSEPERTVSQDQNRPQ